MRQKRKMNSRISAFIMALILILNTLDLSVYATTVSDITPVVEEENDFLKEEQAEEISEEEIRQEKFDQIAENGNLSVHLSAEEGVFAAGSKLVISNLNGAKRAEFESDVNKRRAADQQVLLSYVVDISVRDDRGQEQEPNLKVGIPSLYLGLSDHAEQLAAKASKQVKTEIIQSVLADTDIDDDLSTEALMAMIDYSVDASDLLLSVYHGTDQGIEVLANCVRASQNALNGSSMGLTVQAKGFSPYKIEVSYKKPSAMTMNQMVKDLKEKFTKEEEKTEPSDDSDQLVKNPEENQLEEEMIEDPVEQAQLQSDNLPEEKETPEEVISPEIQKLLNLIQELPQADQIHSDNAKSVYNQLQSLKKTMEYYDNLKPEKGSEEEKIKNDYLKYVKTEENIQKLEDLNTACESFLKYVTYEVKPGVIPTFYVLWNDNNDHQYREKWETETGILQFIKDAEMTLSYRILSKDGEILVDEGTLTTAEEANQAFSFLGVEEDSLYDISLDKTRYIVNTSQGLPTAYVSTYTDYTTGEITKTEYKIDYTLQFKNPEVEHYIVTAPEGMTNDHISLNHKQSASITIFTDYEAYIQWKDDSNRPAEDGSRPRPDAETLKSYSKVYSFVNGQESGTLVTSDFEIMISDQPDESGYYTLSLEGLPAYSNSGDPISYYIVVEDELDAANAASVAGNKYQTEYHNEGNYASRTNGLYADGYLFETLHNTVEFQVKKIWKDDQSKNPESRPSSTFSIWSITPSYTADDQPIADREFPSPIPNCKATYDVPKEGGNTSFVRYLDNGVESLEFPMYDREGVKYIYYGKETAVAGYKTTIDYSTCELNPEIVKQFEDSGYFLNGATIINEADNNMPVPVSKEFNALSIQNRLSKDTPITATFILQKKNEEGEWIPANKEDILRYSEEEGVVLVIDENKVEVTLTGFSAENMNDSFSGITAKKYYEITTEDQDQDVSPEYARNTYRWIETGVSINDITGNYKETSWAEDETGKLIYTEDLLVIEGQKSTILGDDTDKGSAPKDTTGILQSEGDGSHFENTLVGETQVDIKKYFYDAENKNISADPVLANAVVTFQLYRDDIAVPEAEGGIIKVTQKDLAEDGSCWEKLITLDRYDSEGREYRYKVEEVSTTGTGDYNFVRTENYEIKVKEYPEGSGVLIPVMETEYVNTVGPGYTLYFDVEKKWQDDSDQESRKPVLASLYRFRNVDGSLLETPELITDAIELNTRNNWFHKYSLATVEGDTVDNYIIVENGMKVGDSLVGLNEVQEFTSEYFASLKPKGSTGFAMTYLGIIGSLEHEKEDWDGLNYRYKSFTEEKDKSIRWARYVLTNRRIGSQNYEFTKNWNSGKTIYDAEFALYSESDRICTFRLIANKEEGTLDHIEADWKEGYDHEDIIIEKVGEGMDEDSQTGNYATKIKINGLPKFDDQGAQINYSIEELAVKGDDGWIFVKDGSVTVNGKTFQLSSSSTDAYASNNTHRSPDIFKVVITNSLTGSYDLRANKVWRDDRSLARPDVAFSLYRVSTKDDEIRELVETQNTGALMNVLKEKATTKNLVQTDKYWDTKINSFWWECSIKNMPRYDADGYPYLYFGVENMKNSPSSADNGSKYEGYYCNETVEQEGYRPINPAGEITTKDVFSVATEELMPMSEGIFLISDGIHADAEGDFANYYSATVVNKPEDDRTVSGKKLWKVPLGMVVSEEELPVIEIQLYRLLENVKYSDFSSSEEYATYIREHAEKITVDGKQQAEIAKQTISSDDKYKYRFTEDANGEVLPRYNEWGSKYYYYTLEGGAYDHSGKEITEIHNFAKGNVSYQDDDFDIHNVFKTESPFAEVTVEKVWEISKKILDNPGVYIDETLKAEGLEPAKITLYAQALKSNGNKINNSKTEYNNIVLNPYTVKTAIPDAKGIYRDENGAEYQIISGYSAKDGATKTVVKATYTFKTFFNDLTQEDEYLPYYWVNNCRIDYSLQETMVNGYTVEKNNIDSVKFKTEAEEREYGDVYVTDPMELPAFNNIYGDEKQYKAVTFEKIWSDAYVDNDIYRPDAIRFLIKRKAAGVVDLNWKTEAILKKEDFSGKAIWSGTVTDLLKYNPQGKEYQYYIVSETFLKKTKDGYEEVATAKVIGDTVGDYKLANISNTAFSNELVNEASVSFTKQWTLNSNTEIAWQNANHSGFDDLRKMGAIPTKVQYILQRSTDAANYQTIPAADYDDTIHKIEYEGKTVLGREVDLSAATETNYKDMLNAKVTWQHLPTEEFNSKKRYTYRVIEKLYFEDGSTKTYIEEKDSSHGITLEEMNPKSGSALDPDNPTRISMTNDLGTECVRIGKVWHDNMGSENTRPDSIQVKIQPIEGEKEGEVVLGEGITVTIKTTGISSTAKDLTYYSSYLNLPKDIAMTYGVDGAKYVITETFTAKNGAVYSKTITSDNIKKLEDGTYVFVLENTYEDPGRKTLDLTAQKNWQNDQAWKDALRPTAQFTLQYYDRGSKSWTNISDVDGFSKDKGQSATQIVPANAAIGDSYPKVNWTGMYKYWDTVSKDGVAEKIRYRVVENLLDSSGNIIHSYSYEVKDKKEFSINESTKTSKVTIENSVQATSLALEKIWKNEDKNVSLVRPAKVVFEIKYRSKGSSAWSYIPESMAKGPKGTSDTGITVQLGKSTVTVTGSIDQNTWTKTISELPLYDKDGKQYEYQITEASLFYDSFHVVNESDDMIGPYSIKGDVIQTAEYKDNKYSVTFTNALDTGSLSVEKKWDDALNRDGGDQPIQIQLYRKAWSGSAEQQVGNPITLKKENGWKYTWNHLPIYKNDHSDESVYYVRELDTNGQPISGGEKIFKLTNSLGDELDYNAAYSGNDTSINANETTNVSVINTHTPLVTGLEVEKDWGEDLNKIEKDIRPQAIQFELQYSLNGKDWNTFPADNILDQNGAQALKSDDLDPAQVYMAVKIPEGMTAAEIVTKTVRESDKWKADWENLTAHVQYNGKTVDALYRAKEIPLSNYNNAKEIYTTSVTHKSEDKSLSMNNVLDRGKLLVTKRFTSKGSDVTGEKLDELVNIYKVLPEKLTVILTYNDGGKQKTESREITYNAATKAYTSCRFDDLPMKYADGSYVEYSLTDSADGFGEITYGTVETTLQSDSTNVQITNDIPLGKIKVSKLWNDENDREKRRSPVTIHLYRDLDPESEEEAIPYRTWTSGEEALTNWTYTFDNLPIYKADGSGEFSVYTLEESGQNDKYTVNWSNGGEYSFEEDVTNIDAKLTNSYEPKEGNILVSKTWDDGKNQYGLRPEELTYTLEWKVKGRDYEIVPSVEDVESAKAQGQICVAEKNPQTVKVADTQEGQAKAIWKQLPQMYEGEVVSYRVTETKLDGYKAANYTIDGEKTNITTIAADETKEIAVENPLDSVSLTVKKIWSPEVDKLTKFKVLPDSITVQLQYSKDGNQWMNVPVGGQKDIEPNEQKEFIYIYKNLTSAYQYRAIETAITYGDTTIPVTVKEDPQTGNIGNFIYKAATDGEETNIYNELPETKLVVTKTWDDEEDRDSLRKDLKVNLYRDLPADASQEEKAASLVDTVTLKASENWTYTWTQLPMYQNAKAAIDGNESVYTIEEVQNEGYLDPEYKGNDEADKASVILIRKEGCPGYAIVDITNIHNPQKGQISVSKKWDDLSDYYKGRPEYIYLTLKYKLAGDQDWSIVTQAELNAHDNYTDGGVHSIDAPIQKVAVDAETMGNEQIRSWDKLPVMVNKDGQTLPVSYKVFETDQDGRDIIGSDQEDATLKNYSISYSSEGDVLVEEKGYAANQTITNTLELGSLSVEKLFTENSQKVSESRLEKLVEELKLLPERLDVTLTFQCNGETFKKEGTLLYNASEDAYEGVSFDKLPVKDQDGEFILYTIEDHAKGFAYIQYGSLKNIKVNNTGDPVSVTLMNNIDTGKIKIKKNWDDDNDRDRLRTPVTINLYRDLVPESEETIPYQTWTSGEEALTNWSHTFANLPIYKEYGSNEYSVYTLEEVGQNKKYTVSWSEEDGEYTIQKAGETVEADLTNAYEPEKGSIAVTKIWDEGEDGKNDSYHFRPESITYTLQWNVGDEGLTEEFVDVPFVKAVISEPGEEPSDPWTTVGWNDLPVNHQGEKITYKVVESAVENYHTSYSIQDIKLVAEEQSDVEVTNSLDRGKIRIWKDITGELDASELTEDERALITFKVTGPTPYERSLNLKDDFVLEDGRYVCTLDELVAGTYTVEETNAILPSYLLKSTSYVVNLDEEGAVIEVSEGSEDDITVTNDYEMTRVSISKVDILNQNELEGAHLQILDEEGNIVEEWTSTTEAHEVTRLLVNTIYTLKETVAPLGYEIAQESTFILDEEGKIDLEQTTSTVSEEGILLVEDTRIPEPVEKEITVTKYVTVDGKKVLKKNGSFFITLFYDADCTDIVEIGEVKFEGWAHSGSYTFEGLGDGTYYVAETDSEGNVLTSPYEEAKTGNIVTIIGDHKAAFTLSDEQPTAQAKLINDYDKPDENLKKPREISVEKLVTSNGVPVDSKDSFYIGIFSDSNLENWAEVENNWLELNESNNFKGRFTDLPDGYTFYIAETDAEGNVVDDSFPYKVTYTYNNNVVEEYVEVTFTEGETSVPAVTVTNDLQVNKISVYKHVSKDGADVGKDFPKTTFYFSVFTDKALTKSAKDINNKEIDTIPMTIVNGQDSDLESFTMPETDEDITYYVVEVDKEGNPVGDSFKYDVYYNGVMAFAHKTSFKAGEGFADTVCINNDIPVKETTTTEHYNNGSGGGSGSGTVDSTSAKTGDETPFTIYLLLCLAASVFAGLGIYRKRREES